jgi:hypothetical protein
MSYRALLSFVLAAIAVSTPLCAAADDPLPSVETVQANLRHAEGTIAPQYRETATVTNSNGATSTVTELHRGDDERDTFDDGPIHTEEGTFEGRGWDLDANGIVTTWKGGAPATASTASDTDDETTVDTSIERAPGGANLVLVGHTPTGYATRRYLDPTTWRVVRVEHFIGDRRTSVTTFDDVRADNGRTFAHHWRTVSENARSWSDGQITAYLPGPIAAADVAIPAARRQLVEFPTGATSVDLPATFDDEEIIVRVTIGGRGLDLALDSGAGTMVLDRSVAESLGLATYSPHRETNAGTYTAAEAIVPTMKIGALTLHNLVVDALPWTDEHSESVKVVGLIGYDFFAQLGLRIDYMNQRVTAIAPGSVVPPPQSDTVALDVDLKTHQPQVSLGINGVRTEHWVVDTGDWSQLMVFPPYVRAHPDVLRNEQGHKKLLDLVYNGVGGSFDTRWYQLADLDLGGFHLQGARADLITRTGSYDYGEDGLIGGELLSYFTLLFDDPQHRLYLIPNH